MFVYNKNVMKDTYCMKDAAFEFAPRYLYLDLLKRVKKASTVL